MKVTVIRELYDMYASFDSLFVDCLADALDNIRGLCGTTVWSDVKTVEQSLPDDFVYVDTYYNINVYFSSVSRSFLFEEF